MGRDPRILVFIPLLTSGRDKRFRISISSSDQDCRVCQAIGWSVMIVSFLVSVSSMNIQLYSVVIVHHTLKIHACISAYDEKAKSRLSRGAGV